ncbi:MAG: sigma 54-interacting transcriptional regulator [Terriglobia bacterium]
MSTGVQPAFEAALTDRYESLLCVSEKLKSRRCPKELLTDLAPELRKVMNFHYLGLSLYDEEAHAFRIKISDAGGEHIEAPVLGAEETSSWWVYQHQEPLVIPCLESEARFPKAMEFLRNRGIRSVCTLPLATVHRRLGGLVLGSEDSDAYSEREVRFLALMANHVALALDDALNFAASARAQEELERHRAELQRERDRLNLLLDITNQVVSNLDLRDLLRAVSGSVRRVMQCEGAAVLLPDEDGRQLRVHALDFSERKCLIQEGHLVSIDNSPIGSVFRSGKPLVMSTEDLRKAYPGCTAEAKGEGIKAKCVIPLVSRERSVGVLALIRFDKSNFSEDEVSFLGQVAGQVAIAVENARVYRKIADLKDQLAQEKLYLEDEIRSELNFEEIIGESGALRKVLGRVETVAPTDSTVLIYGETGTGKELVARAIHNLSSRQASAFVKLNCAAIPTGLLESELFGHEKGAFTGAVAQRIGRFELANHGTMFLDEIGEVPLELQPKLLRVLQEREFERLGSARTLRTDARLIAATNRDLAAMVAEQKFRSDLFYRLNVFPLRVPPLRERPEDIPLLVRHFTQQFARRMNRTIDSIPSQIMNALAQYHWPGNIRELQNVIERAVILSTGPMLKVSLTDLKPSPTNDQGSTDTQGTLEEAEKKHILAALAETNWVVGGRGGAAVRLGLNRTTLQFRMRKLGLARPDRNASSAFRQA